MKDTLARVLAVLAVLGLAVNGWFAYRNSQRIATHTERLGEMRDQREDTRLLLQGMAKGPVQESTPRRKSKPKSTKAKTGKAKGKRRTEASDSSREERAEARDARVQEAMEAEIADFASTEGLDGGQEADVLDELLALREASRHVREDMKEDRITNFEGRAEIRALREDSDARLVEMLGQDLADILRERLAEERSARRESKEGGKR